MVDVLSFGCRLNLQESEAIRHAAAGHDDLVVVNSCAVTSAATKEAGQAIRRLKRERPDARIVVTGCAAQTEPARFLAMREVDAVLGNALKAAPESFVRIAAGERSLVSDIMLERRLQPARLEAFEARTRAFVQVQNGCDHRCTFCIIPFGRGNSRSLEPEAVLADVRRLIERGHREIVLTGVDVTSYGADLASRPRLGNLVERVLREIPTLERLRLSSLDSIEVDPVLMEMLQQEPRLMPHLHLSLQSGDDIILKRMKRRHSREDALRFADEARDRRPDIVFGADLIAGFPTESEAAFERSLDLIERIGIDHLHVFPYSSRPGTPAARMPALPGAVITERAKALRLAGAERLARALQGEIGKTRSVLAERGGTGRTQHFFPVTLHCALEAGELADITITGATATQLQALP